jgi:hypothetical protein
MWELAYASVHMTPIAGRYEVPDAMDGFSNYHTAFSLYSFFMNYLYSGYYCRRDQTHHRRHHHQPS